MGRVYNFTAYNGVYVYGCKDGGCAYKAGIRKGDTVLSVDGVNIDTALDFKEAMYRAGAGKTVRLRVRSQDGTERDVDVTLDGEK
jgi:serine protease Do